MNYLDALRYLQQRDDWERTGSAADAGRWDLRRMRSLLTRLGDPHLGRRTVHIAGSKGKGSVAAMTASMLHATGAKVGLYTSPHLHRFVERVAVDGEPVAEETFARLLAGLAPHIEAEDAGPYGTISTFEALTALAFLAFREAACEWQVLEVGLGGRLDATNVFDTKDVSVITPLALEHTAVLGDSLEQIAAEKAGIVTPGTPVVMAPQRERAAAVVRAVCAQRGAPLVEVAQACALNRGGISFEGQQFVLRTPAATRRLALPLLGRHQLENAATAVLALEAAGLNAGEATLRRGLEAVRWPARIELIKRRPLVVADGAHDRESARRLVQTLRDDLHIERAVLVVGMSRDKDIDALAAELTPLAEQAVATRARHPRAADPGLIARAFAAREVPVTVRDTAGAAVDAALALATDGATVACGSLFVAAEAREHVLGIAYDPPLTPAPRDESEVQV